jgi:hypothetical protein
MFFQPKFPLSQVRSVRCEPSEILSRLAQVISERKVQGGLRRVLLIQAKRLQWLAARRFDALGGAASVAREGEGDDDA